MESNKEPIDFVKVRQAKLYHEQYNTKERIKRCIEMHTNFKPEDFELGTGLYILDREDIVFDYEGMKNQPRIYDRFPDTVEEYRNQAENGVEGVYGIRKPITVHPVCGHQTPFRGQHGHHRFEAGNKYDLIVAKIDDSFLEEDPVSQIDLLLSDNIGSNNVRANTGADVLKGLKDILQQQTFMMNERSALSSLEKKLEKMNDDDSKKQIQSQIRSLKKTIKKPLMAFALRWQPSVSKKYAQNLVTKAMKLHKVKHLVKLHPHSKDERKVIVATYTANYGDGHKYVEWANSATNNNIQLNLPIAEFVKIVRKYELDNNGSLPKKFTFITSIPTGASSYEQLMKLRKRTADGLEKNLGGIYQSVEREYLFLGQILNHKSTHREDIDKIYDLKWVDSYLNPEPDSE